MLAGLAANNRGGNGSAAKITGKIDMLKGLDPLLSADLLGLLDAMGHGDDLVIADRNFPAHSVSLHTTSRRVISERGVDTNQMSKAILSVFPLDTYVDIQIHHMAVIGAPDTILSVHSELLAIAQAGEKAPVKMAAIERMAFYEAAKRAYMVVQTGETRPFGCFILKKGVIPAGT